MKFITKEQEFNLEVGDVIEVIGKKSSIRFLFVGLWDANAEQRKYGLIDLGVSYQFPEDYLNEKEVFKSLERQKYRIIKSSNLELREV